MITEFELPIRLIERIWPWRSQPFSLFSEASKVSLQRLVQQLVAQSAIEALDKAVLLRLAWRDGC